MTYSLEYGFLFIFIQLIVHQASFSIFSRNSLSTSSEENHPKNPSYHQVCTGQTGHADVLDVKHNYPEKIIEELIKFFFLLHDPTIHNRQRNDVGTQYAVAVFVEDDEQRRIVNNIKDELQTFLDHSATSPYLRKKLSLLSTPSQLS